MDKLITHIPAADVDASFITAASAWPVWDSMTHPQEPPKSGKFAFNYNGDYATERILVVCGAATLTPDDGSAPVKLAAGDSVWFHKGFACQWEVTEPMKKHYEYFDADGNVKAPAAIACDVCGADCEAESWLVNGEEDVCPKCYKEGRMKGGERQIMGEPAPTAPVPVEKKKSKASGPATKKRKSR